MGGGMTAAEKKDMIKQMQGLMTEVVKLDKELSDNQTTNLKSPGLSDGVWGSNTEESYKSILAEHKKNNAAPKDMAEALRLLGEIRLSLATAKNRRDTKEGAKAETPTAPQPKPASAINDDQAKAAFRGLLESIQSGRIKLKAGGDNSVFKQRISRDWGAIIRAYKGPQGVVDAFYGGLALTEPEKVELVKINKDGLDRASAVIGKINQKFLEAINTYIKPFGRALRTERSMARVMRRRQERQEGKQSRANAPLKDLWILSKVAQRKEVARERLDKRAAPEGYDPIPYYNMIIAKLAINNFKENITKEEFLDFPGENLFKKIMRSTIDYWILTYDKENQYKIIRNEYNYKKAVDAFKSIIDKKIKELKEKNKTNQLKSNSNTGSEKTNTSASTPKKTRSTPPTDLTNLRELLENAGHTPGPGPGWAPLEAPFRAAVEEFARTFNPKKVLYEGWNWGSVAKETFGMAPNISGAEQLVGELIAKKKAAQENNSGQPPASANVPTATTDGPVAKAGVVSGLQYLFDKILGKEVKVDQDRFDFIRDSKNFRGVIAGLGGPRGAAEYCVNNCGFDNQEMNNIAKYNNLALDQLGGNINKSSVLAKIFNTFKNIKEQSKRPFKSGIRESVLAENVKLWLQGQRQENKAQASISKSIEIRKMAARKKLGLQS